jgi:hypothetical protein
MSTTPTADEDPPTLHSSKTKTKPGADDQEDEIKPTATHRARILRQNSLLVILMSFLMLSLADIFYYIYENKQFDVGKANLNLDSSNSDAQLTLDANLPLASYLHSYAIRDGHCRLFYSEGSHADPKLVGDIFARVNKPSITTNAETLSQVEVVFDLQNTNFPQFRRLLWDLQFGGADGAKFNIDCSASITITLYRLIPLNLRSLSFALSHFSDEVQLSDVSTDDENPSISSKLSFLSNLRRSVTSVYETVTDLTSKTTAEVQSTSSSRIAIGLNQQLPTVETPSASLNLKSFSVQIPRMAYTLETVGEDDVPTTLLISNTPSEVELFDTTQPELDTVISLDCVSLSDESPECSLLNGLNFEEFVNGLRSGRVSLRADSTPDYAAGQRGNFLTNFLGPRHAFAMQPVRSSDDRRLKHSSVKAQSSDLVSPRDPTLTQGSDCYLVTADSVSESLICWEVEKGFSMMYFEVVDESGAIATVKSTTSWTPSGEFAFATDFSANFRGGYSFTANVSASNAFKNASVLFNYYEHSDRLVHGNAFTSWSFPNQGSEGDLFYSLRLSEDFGSFGDLETEGALTYGDNAYHAKLVQDVSLDQFKYNMTAEGSGRYGGSWTHWWVDDCFSSFFLLDCFSFSRFGSLDSSYLLVDGKIKTTVTGLVSSAVPSTGTSGDLVLNMDARSGSGVNQLSTSNHALWDSRSSWTKEGTLMLNSSFLYLEGTDVNWNSKGAMYYRDNAYAIAVKNYDLNALENFFCHGKGGYGGDFMRWFVPPLNFSQLLGTVGG